MQSLFLSPEIMLESIPEQWYRKPALGTDIERCGMTYGFNSSANNYDPEYVKTAFNHARTEHPDSSLRISVTREQISDLKPPSTVSLGKHADGLLFYVGCNIEPMWVERKGVYVRLDPGEIAPILPDQMHFAPKDNLQTGLRVRLKIFVDY